MSGDVSGGTTPRTGVPTGVAGGVQGGVVAGLPASQPAGTPSDAAQETGPARWRRRRSDTLIRPSAAIVPERSVAGRSLMAVVAIMTFLAAITAGGVQLIASAAADWGSDIQREVTIQVRPVDGRDVEAEVDKAVAVARRDPGIAAVEPYTRARTEAMLAPWLGEGLDLSDLPVPRLIVVRLVPGAVPDFAGMRSALGQEVAGASLDDHRFWIDRLTTMAQTMVVAGLGVLGLMIAATALSVVFATRGAMAGNRDVVEVLHFVGAHDGFIAGEFQRHFLWLGLKGGLIGGFGAALVFGLAHVLANRYVATAEGDQIAVLFGSFTVGWQGYLAIAAAVALVAAITGFTSRVTVQRALRGRP